MFMECIAKVLEQFPYINCSLQGDNIILKKDINIGIAVALPSGNLIVPNIKNADQFNLTGLSKKVNDLLGQFGSKRTGFQYFGANGKKRIEVGCVQRGKNFHAAGIDHWAK